MVVFWFVVLCVCFGFGLVVVLFFLFCFVCCFVFVLFCFVCCFVFALFLFCLDSQSYIISGRLSLSWFCNLFSFGFPFASFRFPGCSFTYG